MGEDLLTRVADLSDQQIRDFADQLTVRQARRMIEAIGLIDMRGIAEILGVAYHRVKMLRHAHRAVGGLGGPRPDELPDALPVPGSSPVYLEREILVWARQAGRIDGHGNPVRLRSVGRTPNAVKRMRDQAGRFTS